MFLKVALIIVGGIVALLSYVSFQSPDYQVAREVMIKASPEAIFTHLTSSQKTNDWMPWSEMDPDVKMSYFGPSDGIGSGASWESPGQMGHGKAEVVEVIANQSVKTKITYTKPMEMEQMSEFSVVAGAEGTLMKWSVSGKNNFIGRVFSVFCNMDKMVGAQFEKGLKKLKDKVESGS